jgi:hypothetical protein
VSSVGVKETGGIHRDTPSYTLSDEQIAGRDGLSVRPCYTSGRLVRALLAAACRSSSTTP